MNCMENKIIQKLKEIETSHNIKILYACESGSRAWGFNSPDSDYDVRFIYVHPQDWYLSIYEKRDVIEYPITDNLDINGWDLRKALQLLRKSNPSLLEWINSPITYYKDINTFPFIPQLARQAFSPAPALYHYLHMAKGGFKEYLQGDTVLLKKYLHVLRPLIAMRYIEEYLEIPPTDFLKTLESITIPSEIIELINKLITMKQTGYELGFNSKIPALSDFIQSEFDRWNSTGIPKIEPLMPISELDDFFRYCLKKCW